MSTVDHEWLMHDFHGECKIIKLTCTWKITPIINKLACSDNYYYIDSEEFATANEDLKCKLRLTNDKWPEDDSDNTTCYFLLLYFHQQQNVANFFKTGSFLRTTLSILSMEKQVQHTFTRNKTLTPRKFASVRDTHCGLVICECKKEDLLGWIFNDNLLVLCELIIYNGEPNFDRFSNAHKSQDLGKLLADPKFSDVRFTVGDKVFNAHKNILASRSAVFEGMFSHNMTENRENHVHLKDCSADLFEKVLKYIYTGEMNDGEEGEIRDLLSAADRYALNELKAHCDLALSRLIRMENVLDLRDLAELYCAPKLGAKVEEFIKFNLRGLIMTDKWADLKRNNLKLAVEILEKCILK